MSFSVIVPAYNRAGYIAATLDAILAQTRQAAQIIVVNDGSTDDTAAVLSRYGDRIVCIDIPNGGPAGARAVGVDAARHPLIAFCDSDDLWLPNHLDRLNMLLSGHTVSFAFSNFVYFRDGVRAARSHFAEDQSGFWQSPGRAVGDDLYIADDPLFTAILAYQPIFPSCMAIRASHYRAVGGIDPAFGRNPSEDLEFILRCARFGGIGIDTRPTGEVRRLAESVSGDWVRTLAGSVDILKYALVRHELTAAWRSAVERQIIVRCLEGIDCAFLNSRFDDVRRFSKKMGVGDLKFKQIVKIIVAHFPFTIRSRLQKMLVGA